MEARSDEAGESSTPNGANPPGEERKAKHDGPRIELALSDEEKHKESIAAATGAAMAHVLGRPDSIRQRAQYAATIASAFSAALVIAAVAQLSSGDESWEEPTKYLVFAAMGLWALTAAMFVYAVAFVVGDQTQGYTLQDLVEAYENYADNVRRRMRWAASVSALALVATVLAVIAETAELMTSRDRSMRLILTASGASDIAALCDWTDSPAVAHVEAKLAKNELTRRSVRIEDPLGFPDADEPGMACGTGTVVRLPRSAIRAAVELDDGDPPGS